MTIGAARRALALIVHLREGESATALLMFAYSFLAMTAYNVVKPATRSKFIADLGADNLPYVQLAAGALIGVGMHAYGSLMVRLPRRRALPLTHLGMAVLLVAFRALFDAQAAWASVAFYFLGLVLGILLISQFWTLAQEIFDARQAKRLFGFIGGGASLGGMVGAGLTTLAVKAVGTENLLLCSAAILALCAGVVAAILRRESAHVSAAQEEEGVGASEVLRLLRDSRHLQLISLVIGFAAIGAAIVEQQLNMAAETFKGRDATDEITGFLAQVTFYLSAVGFLVQVGLTSRIHRRLGIGFALLVLPAGLGATALVMLLNAALWAPALARILDSALRYTVDKTTREILFLPLPAALKQRAKPFVDVTVDRVAKGLGALLVLILIKPWGLGLGWQQVSYASLAITGLWIVAAIRARREYLTVFRASLERRDLRLEDVRLNLADLSTFETLVEELASPDEERVLNAIDLLEALDKRNLVTPLLLHHESPQIRARALRALEAARPEIARRWLPVIEEMLKDDSVEVRGAAVQALNGILQARKGELMRPHLDDRDPRVAVAAALALAKGGSEEDAEAAEATLRRLAEDMRDAAAPGRREVAKGLGQLEGPRFRSLLLQLIGDTRADVAREAIRGARRLAPADELFAPVLISVLRDRRLKADARAVLVACGEPVVEPLGHFLRDEAEDPWVRRHIPGTLALIPCQRSMDVLAATLADADGLMRHKSAAAMARLRREHPELRIDRRLVEREALREARRCLNYLTLHCNLQAAEAGVDSLLNRTLHEKLERTLDRVYRLLGLIYPPRAVEAARAGIEGGDARARAAAVEYLDGLLSSQLRRWVLPLIDEAPLEDRARQANVLLRTRIRDPEDTLAQLVHDEDPVVSATAIHSVGLGRFWGLVPDLEYVLGHRDAKDLYAFEAASWALAAHRLPVERRRALWREPLPVVEVVDRLRRIPLFACASMDELLRIAVAGEQVRHEAGRVLFKRDTAPVTVQLLLEGRVTVGAGSATEQVADAPAALGLVETLLARPVASVIRASEASICLTLDAEALLSMLSDNVELAQGLFRMALAQAGTPGRLEAVLRGGSAEPPAAGELTPIEQVRRLAACPLFARATAEQLLELAPLAREVGLSEGATLIDAGEQPAIHLILSGAVLLEGPGDTLAAGAGDTLGAYETLAGVRARRRARVTRGGRALRLGGEDLLDFLEGRVDLLQGLFAALVSEGRGRGRAPRKGPGAPPPRGIG